MPGIADLILSTEGALDDDLNFEDPTLARELEELRSQRRGDAAAIAPSSSLPAEVKTTLEATEAAGAPGETQKSAGGGERAKGRAGSSQGKGRSLADQILNSSSANDELELEFEAMEQQLQQQLLKYKEQCQSPAGAAPGTSAQMESTAAGAPKKPGSAQPAREASQATASTAEESTRAGTVDGEPTEESPELKALRGQAAQLEEVFPESGSGGKPVEQKPRRQVHARAAEREKNRSEAPADPEMLSLRNALEHLDVKLRAVQKHSALEDQLQRQPAVDGASRNARVIAELQAQNAHLRERFKANGNSSLLHLDKAFFGGDVAAQTAS